MDKGALISCGYYERGGMSGGKYIARAAVNSEGKIFFDLEKQEWFNLPVIEKHIRLSAEKFGELEKLLDKYDFSEPHDERLKKYIALDAPSVSVSVKYENAVYGISERESSMNNLSALRAVRDFFDSL